MENSWTQNKATCYELFPQELPILDTVPSLEAELRKGAKERLASRKFVAQQKRYEKRRVVPTVLKLVHPSPPKFQKCQHSGNFILDREILEPSDYIDFIARPKEVIKQKSPHYVMHKLSSATNRIKTLARPSALHVKTTLERYSAQLSPKQEQHLQNLLEPKPFVTIMESLDYAKQQRSDDAMWRRHIAKQERKLMHTINHWEIELLKIAIEILSKKLRDYYLSSNAPPLTEEGVRISRSVLRVICRFLDIKIPRTEEQENGKNNDPIDEFYVELSNKIGYWIEKIMAQTGITFDKQKSFSYVRKSESFVSINSSVFQLDLPPTGDEAKLVPMSIISLDVIYDCVDAAVATVEKGICERRNSVCIESVDKIVQENMTPAAENGEESKTNNNSAIDIDADASDSNAQNVDEMFDEIEEDQVTVIENIPNEETDENEQEEVKPQQT